MIIVAVVYHYQCNNHEIMWTIHSIGNIVAEMYISGLLLNTSGAVSK